MNRTLIITIIFIIVIAGIFFYARPSAEQDQNSDTVANLEKSPQFSLKDFNGNTVSNNDFSGKYLVVNSWAAWCPFCVDELPDFATAQQEFKNEVVIIAIDRAESMEIAKRFTDEAGVTNDLVFLLDPKDSFYKDIGGFSMPETIFVDKDGFIRDHKRGPMELDEIRQRINNLIKND